MKTLQSVDISVMNTFTILHKNKRIVKKRGVIWGLLLWLGCCSLASAQEVKDSVKIHFHTGKYYLDMDLGENRAALEGIKNKLQMMIGDSVYYRLRKVLVVGGASPEGSIALNKRLSERRAATLFDYLSQYDTFPDSIKHTLFIGRDWEGLKHLVKLDDKVPYREEVLELLDKIAANASATGKDDGVWRLSSLRGGKPYKYMYRNLFPALRASSMYLWYAAIELPPFSFHTSLKKDPYPMGLLEERPLYVYEPVKPEKSFNVALKTNLLYDLATALNYSIEVPFNRSFSALFQHHFPWWEKDNKYCLQLLTFGGEFRWWFSPRDIPASIDRNQKNVLLGHFLGVHGWGGKGDIQHLRKFGCYQFDFWSAGITYGYSMAISKYFNLEFSISAGYVHAPYQHYIPSENWEVLIRDDNKKGTLNYFGPTKAEVSLVIPLQIKTRK